MKNSILIINHNITAAQEMKNNMTAPNTDVICVSSMREALQIYLRKEFCLIILDAAISAEDDHRLLTAIRKSKTTPILILSSQSCHVERLRVLQAGAHAYIGHPYSMEECLAQAQVLMQLYHPGCVANRMDDLKRTNRTAAPFSAYVMWLQPYRRGYSSKSDTMR